MPIPPASRPSGAYTFPAPVQGLYFMVANMFFFALLTWYFDAVLPDAYGQRHPPWFFLTLSYWGLRGCRGRSDDPKGTYHGPSKVRAFAYMYKCMFVYMCVYTLHVCA
jgi:hypothetical protein